LRFDLIFGLRALDQSYGAGERNAIARANGARDLLDFLSLLLLVAAHDMGA
jgi:hypothetical protein